MSTDISKVYLFLAQQGGILAADSDDDGYVIKTEFRDFMEENYNWDGETTEAGKNDLINTFWRSIDTNQGGKIAGTRLKNKNAIDKKEMAAMEAKIAIYEILSNFIDNIDAPSSIADQYGWKKSLSDSLSNFVEKYIKQGGKAEDLEAALAKELPAVRARTTADYAAKDYIEEVLSDIPNYARGDDNILSGIIDRFINEIKKLNSENMPSEEEIIAKVKELVDAYLATAKIGEGDVTDLADYGYSPKNNSALNDLQKAVLLTEALNSVKADAEEKAKFDMSNDGYKTALQDYIDSLKYADFEKLQGSILEGFKNSSFYSTIQEKVDAANLEKVRNEAIKYCDSVYNKGDLFKSAVEQVFGSDYKAAINGMDADSIESSLQELKNIVASYDVSGMTQAEKDAFFAGINNTYDLTQGKNKTLNIANTGTCNGNIITSDRISYSATGIATVNKLTGEVTLNTNNPGTYSATLIVLIDKKQVATKTITVTVASNINTEQAIENIDKWAGTPPEGVTVMTRADGNNVGEAIETQDFDDLYNNDSIISLGFWKDYNGSNWGKYGASFIKERLTNLGQFVIDTLAAAMTNLDKGKLQTAMKKVVDRYAVNPIGDYYYTEKHGNTPANFYNYMTENKDKVKDGLVQVKDKTGHDSNIYGIYFKEFVDAIIAEYNKL